MFSLLYPFYIVVVYVFCCAHVVKCLISFKATFHSEVGKGLEKNRKTTKNQFLFLFSRPGQTHYLRVYPQVLRLYNLSWTSVLIQKCCMMVQCQYPRIDTLMIHILSMLKHDIQQNTWKVPEYFPSRQHFFLKICGYAYNVLSFTK